MIGIRVGCEGFVYSRGGTGPDASSSLAPGEGGTHIGLSAVNRHMASCRPLVPHPRCASTTHGVVALSKCDPSADWFHDYALQADLLAFPDDRFNFIGYDWQKPTDLWGEHPPSFDCRRCSPGSDCHVSGPSGFDGGDGTSHVRDPAERAKMPRELSKAILSAVENPQPAYAEVVA